MDTNEGGVTGLYQRCLTNDSLFKFLYGSLTHVSFNGKLF